MGICSESEMIPGDVNYEYLVVQLDLHLNKWRRHDDSLPSEPGRQHAMKSLTVFFLHNFLQFCICFLPGSTFNQYARMQHILSILFVVVFEIALTWWVMTPFLPLFMLLCLWQVNGSDTAIHSNKIKSKTQTKKRKTLIWQKKFATKIVRQISSKHKQNLESNAAV